MKSLEKTLIMSLLFWLFVGLLSCHSNFSPILSEVDHLLNMHPNYYSLGRQDSVLSYALKSAASENIYVKCDSYRLLCRLYGEKGDLKSALQARLHYLQLFDSINNRYRSDEIVRLKALYREEQIQNRDRQMQSSEKIRRYRTFLIFLPLLLLTGYRFFQWRKMIKENKECLSLSQRILAHEIESFQAEHEILQEKLNLQKNRYVHLWKEHENWKNTLIRNNVFLSRICLDENEYELEEREWTEFYINFKLIYPFFVRELKRACPKMPEQEMRICCLVKLGVKTSRIAALVGQQQNTVSKKKKYILTTYFVNSDSSSLNEYLSDCF